RCRVAAALLIVRTDSLSSPGSAIVASVSNTSHTASARRNAAAGVALSNGNDNAIATPWCWIVAWTVAPASAPLATFTPPAGPDAAFASAARAGAAGLGKSGSRGASGGGATGSAAFGFGLGGTPVGATGVTGEAAAGSVSAGGVRRADVSGADGA